MILNDIFLSCRYYISLSENDDDVLSFQGVVFIRVRSEEWGGRVRGSGGGWRGLRKDSGIKFYNLQIEYINNWLT